MDFQTAIERVLGHEGGYVNNPKDPGGETNWGITKQLAVAYGYHAPMRDMTRNQAKDIYKRAFWDKYDCSSFPAALSFQLFDAAVNHGYGNAARFLQRAVGVADDGRIGPVTRAAMGKLTDTQLVARFNRERLVFYTKLRHFPDFGRGWLRRIGNNLRHAVFDGCDAQLRDDARKLESFVEVNKLMAADKAGTAITLAQAWSGINDQVC